MQPFKPPKSTLLLFYVLFVYSTSAIEDASGQQVNALVIEDCKGIENEVLRKDSLNYVKLPCEDGISMINKVCEFVLAPSRVKVFTTCSSSKLLQSFLNTVGLEHKSLNDDKCTVRSTFGQNISEFTNPFLNFIFDAVTYFHLMKAVVIIDSYTGISTTELQKMLSAMNTAAIIVNLDDEDAMTTKLRRRNKFLNFIVACGEDNLNSLIKHVEAEELLNFPLFWLILTENATRFEEMITEAEVDYTWNITVAEAIHANYEDTSLNHSSVLTEIFMANDLDLMQRLKAACSLKRFANYSGPQIVHKHDDNVAENAISYTLYDYRVKCKGNMDKIQFGNWTKGEGFNVDKIDPSTRMSLEGCHFTIVLANVAPYVMIGENSSSIIGLDIDILKILARTLKFSYTFRLTNFTTLGMQEENGSWTNVFKILIEDRTVDFILPTVDATPARSAAMHFTARLTEISGSIVIRTPNLNADMDDYIRPFSAQVWFVLLVGILIVSICMTLTYLVSPFGQQSSGQHGKSKEEKYANNPSYGWGNSFYTTCSAVLQQGTETSPRYISGRIIFATIFATSVLIIQSYSSLLISFLTTDLQKLPFRNMKQLAENRDYDIGIIASTYFVDVLKNSDDIYLRKIWNVISSKQDNFVDSVKDGLDKVMREKYALLTTDSSVHKLLRKNCSYMAPITKLLRSFKCIAARKHFPYISTFSTVINKLREAGVIKHLYQHYLPDIKSPCKDKMEHQQIDFFNILFLIYIFVAGLGISLVMILIEFCLHRYQQWPGQKHSVVVEPKCKIRRISKKLTRPKLNSFYFEGKRTTEKN